MGVEETTDPNPSPDALEPWGNCDPPTEDKWSVDVLGHPFEARLIPLPDDEEGPASATLIRIKMDRSRRRRRKHSKPSFVILYLHGRNDYFFQAEAAKRFQKMGAAFYALDLRKYGRSLRPWQTIGYTDDLDVYDQELNRAVELVRQDHPNLPLILFAHSTGGLIGTLWAWKHPGLIDGLVLNSAWLELQSMTSIRPTLERIMKGVAGLKPRATVIGESKVNTYHRSISEGWGGSGFDLPDWAETKGDDPSLTGWAMHSQWKRPNSYPAPAAWLLAILAGHRQVENEVHLDCPVLSLASTSSATEDEWAPAVFNSDVVLDPDLVSQRAATLSDSVTIIRLPGKHDLLLSDPPVREALYEAVMKWIHCSLDLV